MFISAFSFAQVVVTGSASGTYTSVAAAVTALNAVGAVTAPTTLSVLPMAYSEVVPAGGLEITVTGSAANSIVFEGNSATLIAGVLAAPSRNHDAVLEIVGADYLTINNFKIRENVANIIVAPPTSNLATEWGIAVLYANTTNGCQNITITNCDIQLNRLYGLSHGIYANMTHAKNTPFTNATATGLNGGLHNMVIQSNTISDVRNGIVIIGPTSDADMNDSIIIGGPTAALGNTISNYGNGASFTPAANVLGPASYGIQIRNSTALVVQNNSCTVPDGNVIAWNIFGIVISNSLEASSKTYTNTISNNTISLVTNSVTSGLMGIDIGNFAASSMSTLVVENNNCQNFNFAAASAGGNTIFYRNTSSCLRSYIKNNVASFASNVLPSKGSVTFLDHSHTMPENGIDSITNNTLIGFSKSAAGGKITGFACSGLSPNSAHLFLLNNAVANISTSNIIPGSIQFEGIFNADGATTSPVKIIKNNNFSNINLGFNTGSIRGIYVSSLQTLGTSINTGINYPSNSLVSENNLSNYTTAASITGLITNSGYMNALGGSASITNNTIHTYNATGTASSITGLNSINSAFELNISEHTIYGLNCNCPIPSGNVAIAFQAGTQTNVFNNKMYDINSLAGGTSRGILSTGGNLNIYNNLIGNITAPVTNSTRGVTGIFIAGGVAKISNNSIYLNASSSAPLFGSSAIEFWPSTNVSVNNTILHNASVASGTGVTSALQFNSFTSYHISSGNNDFIAPTLYFTGATAYNTLSALKAAVAPRDSLSINFTPDYLSTVGSASAFLHINTLTPTSLESEGVPLVGITNDCDFELRNPLTPDIGADEFDGIPFNPCAGMPDSSTIVGASGYCPGSLGIILSLSRYYAETEIVYQWKSSATAGGPYTNILNTDATHATGVLTDTTYYICEITCTNSGVTFTTPEKMVAVYANPTIAASTSSSVICAPATTVTITLSGADSYTFSPLDGLDPADGKTFGVMHASPTGNTVYTITGSSIDGCTNTATIAINVGLSPTITAIIPEDSSICYNSSTMISSIANGGGYPFLITELTHFKDGEGATTPYPLYIGESDADFVEITNTSTMAQSLSGYKVELWLSGAIAPLQSFTYPPGVVMAPHEVVVLHFGTGIDRPDSNYYNTGGVTDQISDGTPIMIILKQGLNYVDVVATNGAVMPGSTGAPSSMWSGYISSSVGFAGCQRQALIDSNSASDWINSSVSDIQTLGNANFIFPPSILPIVAYEWQPISSILGSNTDSSIHTINLLSNTSYTVTVTNSGGCTSSSSVEIDMLASSLSVSAIVLPVSCNAEANGSVTLSAASGVAPYTYSWIGGPDSASYFDLTAGTYTATVTDAHGCTIETTVTITEPGPTLPMATVSMPISCNGDDDGILLADALGATGPYLYQWVGGPSADLYAGVSEGVYTVVVTDIYSCTATATIAIFAPDLISLTIDSFSNIACFGDATGVVYLSAIGALLPVTFSPSTTGLLASSYTFTATDANGCTATIATSLTQPVSPLSVNAVVVDATCHGGVGAVIINASGGTLPYVSGIGTYTLFAGTYTYTVIDANGCTSSTIVTISEPANTILFDAPIIYEASFCTNNDGKLTVAATGGIGPKIFTIAPSGFIQSPIGTFNDLPAGIYTTIATDSIGCTNSAIYTISSTPLISITAVTISHPTCTGLSNGTATLTAEGGLPPLSFSISPLRPQTAPGIFINMNAGSYTVTVTDGRNCTITKIVNIIEPPVITFSPPVVIAPKCNGGSDGIISVSASGGIGALTYSIMPIRPQPIIGTFTDINSGIYVVKATDINGCTKQLVVPVAQPSVIRFTSIVRTNVTCFGGNNGSVVALTSGGTGVKTLSILPSGTPIVNGFGSLTAGTYTLTTTDVNLCTKSTIVVITQPTAIAFGAVLISNPITPFSGSIAVSTTGGVGPKVFSCVPLAVQSPIGTFKDLDIGTYTITATDIRGCFVTTTASLIYPSLVLNDNSLLGDSISAAIFQGNITNIEVYPNPTIGQLYIKVVTPTEMPFTVVVSDAVGKHLKRVETFLQKGENLIDLQFEEYSKGIYFISMEENNFIKWNKGRSIIKILKE